MEQIRFFVNALENTTRKLISNYALEQPRNMQYLCGIGGAYYTVTEIRDQSEGAIVMIVPHQYFLRDFRDYLLSLAQEDDEITVIGLHTDLANELRLALDDCDGYHKNLAIHYGPYNPQNGHTEAHPDSYPYSCEVVLDRS